MPSANVISAVESKNERDNSPSEDGELEAEDPLSDDEEPPLPDDEAASEEEYEEPEDDGWEATQHLRTGMWYFTNRFTGRSQWENPRIPNDPYGQKAALSSSGAPGPEPVSGAPGTTPGETGQEPPPGVEPISGAPDTTSDETSQALPAAPPAPYMGYNPKIHGNYDPKADYAKYHETPEVEIKKPASADVVAGLYAQQATFNRFTGAFQGGSGSKDSEYHNDENKSNRQMNAFFDVDSAANSHEGRSLKAERSNQRLSKEQVKEFNDRRRARKEKKRRDFLMS